jgi:hypothetical protein
MMNYNADSPALPTGVVANPHPAAAGDAFSNDGSTLLRIINGSGGPVTCTLDDPNTQTPVGATAFNPDAALVVAAGATRTFGPFPPSRFNDPNGRVQMSWTATGSVTWELVTAVH